MKKFFIPTRSPNDWKSLLAQPEKHWKRGFSAQALAMAWEQSNGEFPSVINAILKTSEVDHLRCVKLLLAFPEWKVYLPPTRGHPSQNDLFVLGKDFRGDLLSIMVEAKVAESFGEMLGDWLSDITPGKLQRFSFIKSKLGLGEELPLTTRYQLLHRMVSAVMEAERFRAKNAVMLIHSFSDDCMGFENFAAFLRLFKIDDPQVGQLYKLKTIEEISLYAGWASDRLPQSDLQFSPL